MQDASEEKQWITVREAAMALRLSYRQTLRLAEIGTLDCCRTHQGRWLIARQSMEETRKRWTTPALHPQDNSDRESAE